MTNLNALLGPLLLRNECVILPTFGGFVANYVSAKIDVKNGLITPPSKALSFNKSISSNDGLVIQSLAQEKGISFNEAQGIITKEVIQIKASLNQGRRVHFHNVGYLYLNDSGKIAFEQDRFFNLLLSSYGLGNVQFISEEEPQKEVISTPEEVLLPIAPSPLAKVLEKEEKKEVIHPATVQAPSRLFSKIAKYAAVAALVPILFYSFWIPMKTDVLTSKILYSADFNPFTKSSVVSYKQEKAQVDIQLIEKRETFLDNAKEMYPSVDVFTFPIDSELQLTVKKKIGSDHTEISPVNNYSESEGIIRYHAIVGCFTSEANANNLISELNSKGFHAYQVDVKGGLHRVSAGATQKSSDLSEIRQKLSDMNLSSWVLKK